MDLCLKILQIQAICITRRLCWIPGRKKVFLKNVVKFFFSRLRNFCFAVYFNLFVKFSGLFLPATFTRTRTRNLYPRVASRDPRHLDILVSTGVENERPGTNMPACVLENRPLIITKTSDKISINQNWQVSGSYPDLYVQRTSERWKLA